MNSETEEWQRQSNAQELWNCLSETYICLSFQFSVLSQWNPKLSSYVIYPSSQLMILKILEQRKIADLQLKFHKSMLWVIEIQINTPLLWNCRFHLTITVKCIVKYKWRWEKDLTEETPTTKMGNKAISNGNSYFSIYILRVSVILEYFYI